MHWRRHLPVIWLAQFFSSMAFAFAIPFAPYFLQELGVVDRDALTCVTFVVHISGLVRYNAHALQWGLRQGMATPGVN